MSEALNSPAAGKRPRIKIAYALLFILSAFLGALVFSWTTSPLYSDVGYDSAMFQTIGKYWLEGVLPYTGLFDHKGPIIFLINAIGYALCGRTGVFLLQLVFLALDEALSYKILRERFSRGVSLAAALFLPLALAVDWGEANMTEEYILPLLFLSYYLMLRWSYAPGRGDCVHPPRYAAVYGLCFAFALLTRLTNALGVCVGTAFIAITLAVRGQWKNLLQNAAAFLIAALLPIAAFCVYFAAHGALYDMLYGTLIYNFEYLSGSDSGAASSLFSALVLARRYFAGWALVAASLWSLAVGRENKTQGFFWLCVSLANTLFMYTLNDYAHYGICLLPFLYVAPRIIYPPAQSAERCARLSRAAALCIAILAVLSSGVKVYNFVTDGVSPQEQEVYEDDYSELVSLIPDDGRDSFVAINCARRLYLEEDIRPSFRFFTLQQWMSRDRPDFAEEMRDEFVEARVEWVLRLDITPLPLIDEVIESDYTLVAQSEHGIYGLYRLNADQSPVE